MCVHIYEYIYIGYVFAISTGGGASFFRQHAFLDASARVTLQAAGNHFSCNLLFCPSFSKKVITVLMYSTLVGPLPLFNVAFVCLRRSTAAEPTISQYFCCAASADTDTLSLCFDTLVTSDVSPTLAMAQILPLTTSSVFSGGCRAH